jgi:ribonuclease R
VLETGASECGAVFAGAASEAAAALYKVLRQAREERGAIDFETVETRIVFNEDRKIDAIVPVHRNDAHKLIEECMLCANVAAARFFDRHPLPVLYRVHEGPSEEKLENLRAFLGELGLGLRGGVSPTPRGLPASARDCQQPVMMRTSCRPCCCAHSARRYTSPKILGHFGLNYRIRALYVADTPLSGSARASGDPQRDPVGRAQQAGAARARRRAARAQASTPTTRRQ